MFKICWITLVVGLLSVGTSYAQVGMLTQLSGEVTLSGKDGSRTAVAFLKFNSGDSLKLGKDGRVQLVYFGNGRQEIWKGEGQVDMGSLEGHSASLTPAVTQLPPLVINQLAKTPAAGQQGTTGMIMVRSLGDPDALEHLEKQYAEMRGQVAADDTTPEVFLLSGLLDLKEYDRAKKVLSELKTKQLAQPSFEAVVNHFGPLVERAAAAK